MILTITVNPSVDYLYKTKKFKSGDLNRVTLQKKMVGGKGINAARVASLLGSSVTTTGFIGGENGKYILEQSNCEMLFKSSFIGINENTRNCFTIIDDDGEKTEINEYGGSVKKNNYIELLDLIKYIINNNKITAISINGSLSPNMKDNSYQLLINEIKKVNAEIKTILDSSGTGLINALEGENKPDYIKPNENELSDFLNTEVTTNPHKIKEEILNSKLSNINNIFVSLGNKGVVVKHYEKYFYAQLPPIKAVNTEGSGDSMVGGLLASLDMHADIQKQIAFAISAGTANALEEKTGFIGIEKFKYFLKKVSIVQL